MITGIRFQTQSRNVRRRPLSSLYWALVFSALFLRQAKADFLQYYDLSNFTLTNTNSDGSASSPDAGKTLVIIGPNNGSDLPGMTDFTIFWKASGLIQFQYLYNSLDTPGFDYAGYLEGTNFVQLADTDGQSGTVQLTGTIGEEFGFRVGSLDNTGEPGILTISDFSAPVPETGSVSLMLVASCLTLAARKRLSRTLVRRGARS